MAVTNPSPSGGPGRRPESIGGFRRSDPFTRRVGLAWRRLTAGGGKTLLACSGGADSAALLLALAMTTRELVVAHVMHDLRPRADAEGDRDAVRALADSLGLPFADAEVAIASAPGNKEDLARRERYAALARLAGEHRCSFVATAHHADDQLETMLMALLRGAGVHGLRGIAPHRPLMMRGDAEASARTPGPALPAGPAAFLIRPMLHCTRAEARAACAAAGVEWREDATNLDTTRRRAAIRHQVLPILRTLAPEGARHASHTAELLRDAARLVDDRVDQVFGSELDWSRDALRVQPAVILGVGLRRAFLRVTRGRRADTLTSRVMSPVIRAIRDRSTEPRRFQWTAGVTVHVTARSVEMRDRHPGRVEGGA